MSSGKTLREQYVNLALETDVGVVKLSRYSSAWTVFTNEEEATYSNWQTAIKVAYGERTP